MAFVVARATRRRSSRRWPAGSSSTAPLCNRGTALEPSGGRRDLNRSNGAAAAAAALAEKLEQDRKTLSDTFTFVPIVVPLVVVDAPLFRYTLSSTGEEELTPIKWIRVLAPVPRPSASVCVLIVTLES